MTMTRFSVKNYKCLADVSIDLTPVHVLIGQNDSGKTSLLEAIYAFFRSSQHDLQTAFLGSWQGKDLVFHHSGGAIVEMSAEWTVNERVDNIAYGFTVEFPQAGRQVECVFEKYKPVEPYPGKSVERTAHGWTHLGYNRHTVAANDLSLADFSARLRKVHFYRFDARVMAQPATKDPKRRYRMNVDGYGLSTLLDDLSGYRNDNLRDEFCSYFPQFQSFRVESKGDGRVLIFETAQGSDVPAEQASDGALLFLGFLALCHMPKPPRMLLIEEPENGIYPTRLREVINLFKNRIERDPISPQVIFTTHSPYLVSLFEPEEVTFMSRQFDGSVRARCLKDSPHIQDYMSDGFYLGEVWYNLDEEELFPSESAYATADDRD